MKAFESATAWAATGEIARRFEIPLVVNDRRLRPGAIDVAHILRAVLRSLGSGGFRRVGRDRIEFGSLLLVDMLDRALTVTGCERAGNDEQNGDSAELHRLPPFECERGTNARAVKCGRTSAVYAAGRAA